jgi:hypothetical protein
MSSRPDSAAREEAERIYQEGVRVAERVDPAICGILTDLARAKGLVLKEPITGEIHRSRPTGDHCYAQWHMTRDRGHFLVKVELHSDHAFAHLYLKASLQSRFWDREAEKLGEALGKATGLEVATERTQSDGIITYSATWTPPPVPPTSSG